MTPTDNTAQATQVADPKPHRPSAWAVRGMLSTAGQTLVLISGLKSAKSGTDRGATIGFASVNLLANAINVLFGAQKKDDPHQLRFLEDKINTELAAVEPSAALPTPGQAQGVAGQGTSWLAKHSVQVSEVGLRTVGSLSLIAPITGWGKALRNLRGGMSVAETFKLARSTNKVTYYAGMLSLAGKFFTVAATEPDPYSPKPMTVWRAAREKLMFRMSSISEAACGAWMSYDAFTNPKQRMVIGNKERPNLYGGFGNALFDVGYIARWVSPYGTREVDMGALYAHVAQGIAALPEEKRSAMLDKISKELAAHFSAKGIEPKTISAGITQAMDKQPAMRIAGNTVSHTPPAAQARAL